MRASDRIASINALGGLTAPARRAFNVAMPNHAAKRELRIAQLCQVGDTGPEIRRIQEWLTLHGVSVVIDGWFGPATAAAVRRYQNSLGTNEDGVVTPELFEILSMPLRLALDPIPVDGRSLGGLVVAYAQQHLAQHPREVGGQNSGPWVRAYTGGGEGKGYPWCAGFVSFCLRQACATAECELPIGTSLACDLLAVSARKEGRLLAEADRPSYRVLTPGSLFLVRASPSDWTHTGIVLAARSDHFDSIEGNTNAQGTAEGHEVCTRIRGYGGKDFVRI